MRSDFGTVGTERSKANQEAELERQSKIMEMLEKTPGMTQSEISKAIGVSPATAGWILGRMSMNGLIRNETSGSSIKRWFIEDMDLV